ncbi:MAG TPA: hypothetical protein VK983_01635 [Candidatus Limnocylindrales bacterium]|nr:hypothetical protein [Candidatus Limnocylindrales bacterium]
MEESNPTTQEFSDAYIARDAFIARGVELDYRGPAASISWGVLVEMGRINRQYRQSGIAIPRMLVQKFGEDPPIEFAQYPEASDHTYWSIQERRQVDGLKLSSLQELVERVDLDALPDGEHQRRLAISRTLGSKVSAGMVTFWRGVLEMDESRIEST